MSSTVHVVRITCCIRQHSHSWHCSHNGTYTTAIKVASIGQLWCKNNTLGNILWASTKHFRHLERSYLLLLYGIGYNVIKWSHCELKRDLLCFLNICNYIISPHINANPMEQSFYGTFTVICRTDLLS